MVGRIYINHVALSNFCRRHKIARSSLFGSVRRDDFDPDSDINFHVEFLPAEDVDLFGIAGMEFELARLLDAEHTVELRTPEDVSQVFREEVCLGAELQCAAA